MKEDLPRSADPATWKRVQDRVKRSLAECGWPEDEWSVTRIQQVQNVALWRKYADFVAELSRLPGRVVNERELFHYTRVSLDTLLSSRSVGFDPRL